MRFTLPALALVLLTGPLAAQASPRDSARATVGEASLLVDYGRPFKRGREIYGGLVPFDAVWRTGANEATHFTTSADLRIGSLDVPAGTYTLYTVPGPERWQLIVNRQTGQWGTTYSPAQDLGRVAMTVAPLPKTVEQLTIAIVPADDGATLRISWDRTVALVPIVVR